MKPIKLNNSSVPAIIDDEDYPYISRFSWQKNSKGDVVVNFGDVSVCMSQFLIKGRNGAKRLHRNGDRLDNRKSNLFLAGANVKTQKSKKALGKSSIYKGVSYNKLSKKWRALIKYDGKAYYLGTFTNEIKAAKAYDKAAKKFYGSVAYLNIIKI